MNSDNHPLIPTSVPEISECFKKSLNQEDKDAELKAYRGYTNVIETLPVEKEWERTALCNYQGFWIPMAFLPGVMASRERFQFRDDDILLASHTKSGTAWLKTLIFAAINRHFCVQQLLSARHAHDCALFLEGLFAYLPYGKYPDLNILPTPRFLATHTPYSLLPDSAKASKCKIVYIARDPKDVLVSTWHFIPLMKREERKPLKLEKAFELFCSGASLCGPIWNHILEYWQESRERPEKVLFLKYEDLMEDPQKNLKRIAKFIGCRFSESEEREGVVREIIRMCSIESLSSLEVNRVGERGPLSSSAFFRKGKVGDWKEHLTPDMVKTLDAITYQKLHGYGLSFGNST